MLDHTLPETRNVTPPQTVDILVFGAGAAGMTAALIAKLEGLDVLLCEKTGQVGGITATSGGTTWIPGTRLSVEAGVPDHVEDARKFLDHVVGNRGGNAQREAFLKSGPAAIDELTKKTDVRFVAAKAHPDYIEAEGGAFGGRALSPTAFDGRLLGKDFKRIRPPRSVFMGLGGMMVGRDELLKILNRFSSLNNFITTMKIVLRYFKDRLSYTRGTRILMGNALVGQLFYSLKKNNVNIEFDTPLTKLIIDNGKIIGAEVDSPSGKRKIFARKGVVLATGGIAWNRHLRDLLYPEGTKENCLAPRSNTGDGVHSAMDIGAKLNASGDSPALWMPCSFFQDVNGELVVWPHIILDRAKPGLLAVNRNGERFVNESNSYHDFCMGAIKSSGQVPSIPAFLIVDDDFIHKYGLGLVLPNGVGLNAYLKKGYIKKADDLASLAKKLGINADNLQKTVARYNKFAETGNDADFGRGTSTMNRFNGDAAYSPNPCMGTIGKAPFYAVEVRPFDLASSAGLDCDEYGRVIDDHNNVIDGLFACGNDASSIFRGTYPGPGTTIGPAIVFGWRIAKYIAGKLPSSMT